MTVAVLEKSFAFVGAIIVALTTSIQLKNDWHTTGLDNNVTKLLLGLMAFGCLIVILASLGILGAA